MDIKEIGKTRVKREIGRKSQKIERARETKMIGINQDHKYYNFVIILPNIYWWAEKFVGF